MFQTKMIKNLDLDDLSIFDFFFFDRMTLYDFFHKIQKNGNSNQNQYNLRTRIKILFYKSYGDFFKTHKSLDKLANNKWKTSYTQ